MSDQTVVSIVTPSFNQGDFLEETIRSVISQEGDFLLDYVIRDGGSTDGSIGIIEKYDAMIRAGKWGKRCGGIRYSWVSEKDKGQADAISKGFASAKGEILAWLNSDDVYMAGAVQKAVEFFRRTPDAGMVYGRSEYIDEAGRKIGEYPTEPFDLKRLALFNFISQPSVFFRKSAYAAAGGLDAGLSFAMDYDLWLRIAKRAKVEHLPETLSLYRLHSESKTVSDRHAIENSREVLEAVVRYFKWAPPNRVYVYCYNVLKSKLGALGRLPVLLVPAAITYSIALYLKMNRGFKVSDFSALNPSNIGKALRGQRF